jgi:hypothetical protein
MSRENMEGWRVEWLKEIDHWLVSHGLPEELIHWALVPFCAVLLYYPIYEALHAFGLSKVRSHSLTLFLLLTVPWLVFEPYFFTNTIIVHYGSPVIALLLIVLIAVVWTIFKFRFIILPGSLCILILFASAFAFDRLTWNQTLFHVYGALFLAAGTLSIPRFLDWLHEPAATPHGRVGVLVAQIDLDQTGQMQAGLIGALAREFEADRKLREIIDLKQLHRPIRRKPDDTFGEQRLMEAVEVGRENNASLVVFGTATLRPQQAIDLVIAIVDPEMTENQNWDIAIDVGGFEFGIKLINFLAKVIGGQTYMVLGDCATAEVFFRDARSQLDLGEQTNRLAGRVQLWEGHSIIWDAATGRAPASRILDAIEAYERAATASDLEVQILAKTGVGRSYRVLSQFQERAENLKRAVSAYDDAIRKFTSAVKATTRAAALTGEGVAYEKLAAELEGALAISSSTEQPMVFAENAYKSGVANMVLANIRIDKEEVVLRGLGQLACALIVFNRANSTSKARTTAYTMKKLAEPFDRLRLRQFRQMLESAKRPEGCDYQADEILALIEKWAPRKDAVVSG